MYVREKKMRACIYIYSIRNQIAYLLDAIYYSMHVIYDYLGILQYGGNKEKMLDLLKCASNRNLLSGETLTSGQEPCGLTGTSWCFQPRCLQFKFPVFRYCNYVE